MSDDYGGDLNTGVLRYSNGMFLFVRNDLTHLMDVKKLAGSKDKSTG